MMMKATRNHLKSCWYYGSHLARVQSNLKRFNFCKMMTKQMFDISTFLKLDGHSDFIVVDQGWI